MAYVDNNTRDLLEAETEIKIRAITDSQKFLTGFRLQ